MKINSCSYLDLHSNTFSFRLCQNSNRLSNLILGSKEVQKINKLFFKDSEFLNFEVMSSLKQKFTVFPFFLRFKKMMMFIFVKHVLCNLLKYLMVEFIAME